jgi:hypothetical protein
MRTFISAAMLLYLSLAAFSQSDTNLIEYLAARGGNAPMPFLTAEKVDILKASNLLRESLSVPLCFETEALDPKEKGITVHQLKQSLEELSNTRSLTSAEQDRLDVCKSVEESNPNSIISWRLPVFRFDLQNATPQRIVDQFLDAYKDYILLRHNSSLVLRPRNSILDFTVEKIVLQNTSLGEALSTIAPQLAKRNIAVASFGSNGVLQMPIEKINIETNTPMEDVLTLLSESAGPDIYWFLGGMKGARVLSFSTINRPK